MNEIVFMCTVVNRSESKKFISFFKENEVLVTLDCLGKGTAPNEFLDLLGIGEPERDIFFMIMTAEKANKIMKRFVTKMHLDVPGTGIAFTVPISSIGGTGVLKLFAGIQEIKKGDEKMEKELDYEVVLAITNRGYVDMVMEAARSEGATGGTVIHAKGTGLEHAEKFFGVSIAAEREIVFILVEDEIKSAVMKAIMNEAGMNTKAKTMVFSMPVSEVIGLQQDEDNE